ncbi:nuclear calmodulin-binding protein-like protein [Thermogutta terrifontis]|uniref:Nuclear calmodulin-binding protein-like protein n=2 Tax=Thermogutta terrifontis TaxID=1331910 RepID=A0A286RJ11_9BACT|nr:nuclear calmodulin-binding protein-like protein [Thermogutta terrifontis]
MKQIRCLSRFWCLTQGENMFRRIVLLGVLGVLLGLVSVREASAQQAFGRQWARTYSTQDWQRFYHYPYVYYPQNFYGPDYFKSSEDLYYRYPPEMRIPVYNRKWQNFYPEPRRYHQGHHFILDVF